MLSAKVGCEGGTVVGRCRGLLGYEFGKRR